MDKETLWRKLAQNQGDYYELMQTARGVIPEDILKGYERGAGHMGVSDEMVGALLREWYGESYSPGALGPEVRDYHRRKARAALYAALSAQ